MHLFDGNCLNEHPPSTWHTSSHAESALSPERYSG